MCNKISNTTVNHEVNRNDCVLLSGKSAFS